MKKFNSSCVLIFVVGLCLPVLHGQESFRRGDVNADGEFNITDGIYLLNWLFLGSQKEPTCEDAADTNDSGEIDISDAIFFLSWRFLGGPAPVGSNDCGSDPTDNDGLGCRAFRPCETNNLWWDMDWQTKGSEPPIEVLGDELPQIGHPTSVRVRVHVDEETPSTDLDLRIVKTEEGLPPGGNA